MVLGSVLFFIIYLAVIWERKPEFPPILDHVELILLQISELYFCRFPLNKFFFYPCKLGFLLYRWLFYHQAHDIHNIRVEPNKELLFYLHQWFRRDILGSLLQEIEELKREAKVELNNLFYPSERNQKNLADFRDEQTRNRREKYYAMLELERILKQNVAQLWDNLTSGQAKSAAVLSVSVNFISVIAFRLTFG